MKLKPTETGLKTIPKKNNTLTIKHIKDLSIQISLSGLSFCILNRTTNSIELLETKFFNKKTNPFEALEHLKVALESRTLINQMYASVLVIYQNDLSSLVPKSLFSEQQLADYLKFNSKILKSDYISYDEIAINDSVNVYVPYVNINNFIFDRFGPFEYKHASTILIDRILQSETKLEENNIYVNINKQHFELLVVINKKLQLYNSFEYSTKEDLIYFLLFAMEQLDLNPETIKLKLMGNIEKDDELYTIIYNYVRFVVFYEPNYDFGFNHDLVAIRKHQDAIILNSF